MALIDGKIVADGIRRKLAEQITNRPWERPPRLEVVLIGSDPASTVYVDRKRRACSEVGIESHLHHLNEQSNEQALYFLIDSLNQNPLVDGVLVQLPLPRHFNVTRLMDAIDPTKDVDGFHPLNRGKLFAGDTSGFVPCTPLGISALLQHYAIPTTGKRVVILGRSNLVGKPLALLLMQQAPWGNATVTVAHSHSLNVHCLCREADILVAAIGQPHFVTECMVKEGAVVIDVGTSAIDGGGTIGKRRLVGDVDFIAVQEKCSWITPVPGGVGPMTIAMLLSNTWQSYCMRLQRRR